MLKWLAVIVGVFALVVTVLCLGFLFVLNDYDPDFLSIDNCLDGGGRWNYESRTCER